MAMLMLVHSKVEQKQNIKAEIKEREKTSDLKQVCRNNTEKLMGAELVEEKRIAKSQNYTRRRF